MKLRVLLLKQVWGHHSKWKNGIDLPYLKVCVKIHLLNFSVEIQQKYASCRPLFVCEASSFDNLLQFSLYYFKVNVPWYESRSGAKLFKRDNRFLVGDSLKWNLVLSITNFGCFPFLPKREMGKWEKLWEQDEISTGHNNQVVLFLESVY